MPATKNKRYTPPSDKSMAGSMARHPTAKHGKYATITLAMMAKGDWQCFDEINERLGNRIEHVVILINDDDEETYAHAIHSFDQPTIVRYEWSNHFGNARNVLMLEAAKQGSDYVLWLDPDSPLIGDIPTHLHAEFYAMNVKESETGSYYSTHIIRKDQKMDNWVGAAHELFVTPGKPMFLPMCYIDRRGGGGIAESRTLNFVIPTLEKEFREHPDDARSCFYLGQAYRAVGMLEKAAEFYEKRLGIYGFDEEEYYSLYCLGLIAHVLGDKARAELWQLRAHAFRPSRRECVAALIRLYAASGSTQLAHVILKNYVDMPPSTDLLFVEDGPREIPGITDND